MDRSTAGDLGEARAPMREVDLGRDDDEGGVVARSWMLDTVPSWTPGSSPATHGRRPAIVVEAITHVTGA
jgi:hypothetical protein